MQLGMQDPSRRRTAGVILAVAALVLSALAVRAPDATAGHSGGREDDWVETTLASMTLEEKVGQLFMTNVYGSTADTQDAGGRGGQPGAVRRRQRRAADRQVPARRHHLLRLDQQRAEPAPDRRALQRHPGRRAQPAGAGAVAGRHRPGGRHRRPDRAAGHPAAGQHGARRRPQQRATRRPPPPSTATSCGDGHQLELRPGRRRQRQPGQPGHRRPLVRREPAAGRRHDRRPDPRLHRRRRRRRGQALPRPRRHRHRQPHRPAGHRPHPRGVGAAGPAAVPGRHRRGRAARS